MVRENFGVFNFKISLNLIAEKIKLPYCYFKALNTILNTSIVS
jgi:hypothetical protein